MTQNGLSETSEIREFYARHFESIGREDPMSGNPGFSALNTNGWSSYNMGFDDYDQTVAVYGAMWKAKDYPAFGSRTKPGSASTFQSSD
jgi:hypothetical protein